MSVSTTAAAPSLIETPAELCERWRISRSHLYELMKQGLPSHRAGRSRRFIAEEVDAWLMDRAA